MRSLVLLLILASGCVQLAPPKDDCESARRIFQHCGVSLPLLDGQACLGVPLTLARCIVKVGNDCDELAAISSHLDDCIASANETLPPLEDAPLVGDVDAGDAGAGGGHVDAGDAGSVDGATTPDLSQMADAATASWTGLSVDDSLAAGDQRTKSTPALQPGTYRFTMTGSGDADLYVRIGLSPTLNLYDCRPFLADSNEVCTVTLSSADKLYTLVRSANVASTYHLAAEQLP